MCRLMYLPSKVRPHKNILTNWLDRLVESQGGHGNGYAIAGKITKGIKLSVDECVSALISDRRAALWHTRRISCGEHTNELCHPFTTRRGCALVHNGHWARGAFAKRLLKGEWSDTKVAAYYIKLYGFESFADECMEGVWLHLTPNGVQVLYRSGSLYVERDTGALASEPCHGWGSWSKAESGLYLAGRVRPARTMFSVLREVGASDARSDKRGDPFEAADNWKWADDD